MRTLINVGLCTYVMYAKCQNLRDSGHRGKKEHMWSKPHKEEEPNSLAAMQLNLW